MLSKIILELNTQEKIDYRKSSIFQSVLLNETSKEYAAKMHEMNLRPYSQYVYYDAKAQKTYWNIQTSSDEAYENLIVPIQNEAFTDFTMEHNNLSVHIVDKRLETVPLETMFKDFYTKSSENTIRIKFLTPTAFKQNGRYIFYPDLRLIYQSLMKKCSAVSDKIDFMDDDTLEQLIQYSEIVRYALRSTNFPMSSVNIPSFIGDIQIRIHGPALLSNFIYLLMKMGEYLGVGIKSAMGMGAIQIINRRDEHDRTRS